MIICSDITDNSNEDFEKLIFLPQETYILSKENRTLKRKLRKEPIRLDDNFNAQKRNRD
jgi:hypothetical protein